MLEPAVQQQATKCSSQVIGTAVNKEGVIRTEMCGEEGTEVKRPRKGKIGRK